MAPGVPPVVLASEGIATLNLDGGSIVQLVVGAAVGILIFSLKRNISSLDHSILSLAGDIKALGASLNSLQKDVVRLEVRLDAVEERCHREHTPSRKHRTGELYVGRTENDE